MRIYVLNVWILSVAADFALVDDAEMDGNHFEEFTARWGYKEEFICSVK